MVNPDEDILQQFAQEPVVTNDLVDRGELRNVPLEELINARPDTGQAEGALTLLAGNTATANDAQPRGLNAYRASGASVQPAKSAAEIYNQLHPEAATRIQRFFELAEERGLGLKPGSMNRDYGTQAKMYANRASNPYPVAPPGGSAHMGFATDFSGYKPEKLQAIRELAKEVGLVYGGNWNGKSFDPVHIQLGPGNEVTRYIQQHVNPQAGTVNWEGVRSTALPEDFLKRAIAAAQGQNVDATYVPTREARVEGASNATGSATVEPDAVKEADAKVEVTQKRKDIDFAKLIKMLDDSSHGGADYLSRSMQANAQQAQANRSRSLAQIAQFDQEQVNKMAEALKGGKTQGYKEGGPKLPDRPEYEMIDNSDAVDATPSTSLEQLFQTVTGGRNLQNDISNIKSRLPTGQDYGHALLEQRDATQAINEQGRKNLREGYANRDIPQMLLGTGQGVMGLVNPAMAPINAGFEVLSKTAGKFDPRAKVEADLLGLVGTEGTGVAQKLHNLELPKSSWDALLKKYQDAGPQAMAVGIPAAVAAAEKPVEAATRSLSPVGLYSHAAEMAEGLPQAKGTPEQMRAMLFDKYGVKPAELEGYEEKFAGRPSVTKEELAQHFRERMPQVEEKVLRGPYKGNVAELQAARDAAEARGDIAEADRIQASFERQLLGDAKYQKWSLPGGENYREVQLALKKDQPKVVELKEGRLWGVQLPDGTIASEFYDKGDAARAVAFEAQKAGTNFYSSHWNEPDVLAHIRMSDRTGPNGEKLLHVEELQSDWGQQGRQEGFVNPEEHRKWEKNARDIYQEVSNAQEAHRELTNRIAPTINEEFKAGRETPREYEKRVSNLIDARQDLLRSNPEWQASLKRVRDANDARNNISPRPSREGVPTAPYVTSTQGWTDLALKRVMKEAAEGGYEGVVFTPGAEQAKRYDLTNHIDSLHYDPEANRIMGFKDKENVFRKDNVKKDELPSIVGKDVADKLLNTEIKQSKLFDTWNPADYPSDVHTLEGQNLSVGGEGMKGYYDKIVPTQLQKLVKGYDKDVKLGTMQTNSLPNMLHLPITDKMREHILKGQKAYKRGGRVGYADGGLVTDNGQTPDGTGRQHYDAYGNVSDAQGGPVRAVAYDQDRVNTLAQQLNEGTYG